MSEESLYEILGVTEDASEQEIREAYRRLLMKVHPDQGGSDALFRVVHDAYETLVDPRSRERYDRARKGARRSPPPEPEEEQEQRTTSSDDWQSAPPDDEASVPYTAATGPLSVWSRFRGLVAANPSLTMLLVGALLLFISVAANVFGPGPWGIILVLLGLNGLWGRRRAARHDNLRRSQMDSIDAMWGTDFELYLVEVFLAEDYDVRHTGRPGDYGADLLLRRAGTLTVVQAKRTVMPVGQSAVREAAAARAHYGAQYAMVVTNGFFTASAENLAASNQVGLWDRVQLAEVVATHSSQPPEGGFTRAWDEFRLGLPGSFRVAWAIVAIGVGALFFAASTLEALDPGKSRPRRRRRRRR